MRQRLQLPKRMAGKKRSFQNNKKQRALAKKMLIVKTKT
jgi:hypothetical protein